MAAEVRRLISDLEEILAREGLENIHDLDELIETQSHLSEVVTHLYWQGQIPKHEATQLITSLAARIYESVLQREKKDMGLRAMSANMECITTDTHGSKTAKMLAETGIPWGTGEASRGLAVAVVHPDIGIAGSHRNAVTIADYSRFCELILDNSLLDKKMPYVSLLGDIVTPDSLITTAHETASEALDEFSSISPNGLIPRLGSTIMFIGLDFLREYQFQLIIDAVGNTLRTHPAVINDKTGQDLNIDACYLLGQYGGIIYGGITHPNPAFSSPNFYNLRNVK